MLTEMQNSPDNTSTATYTAGHLSLRDRTVYMMRPIAEGSKGESQNSWFATVYGRAIELEANAHRLQACWNACEGIPTEKLDKRVIAEYVAVEEYIASFGSNEAELELHTKSLACQLLALSFAGKFKGVGATNYLEMQMHDPEIGAFSVTIQRIEGQTPAEKSDELSKEIDLLKNKVLELEKFQKAVSVLKQYFTSSNCVPVDKATIKAEDFWRITGISHP